MCLVGISGSRCERIQIVLIERRRGMIEIEKESIIDALDVGVKISNSIGGEFRWIEHRLTVDGRWRWRQRR